MRNVAIVVEDEPSDELLDEMEIEPATRCSGCIRARRSPSAVGLRQQLPDRITLFQQPIEDECDGDEDEIVVAIGETLIHELGHYFGLSEDEIMEIEERYWRGERSAIRRSRVER